MYLLICIVMLLVILCIGVGVLIYVLSVGSPRREQGSLEELVREIKRARDDEARELKERELREYAVKKMKDKPGNIMSSLGNDDLPVTGINEYIPFGLSKLEKDILREFYGRDL
jgi:hypothetical protein